MNKELIKIIDDAAWLFDNDMWLDLHYHFNVKDLEELDAIKFDDVMQYVNSVNEDIYRHEEMYSSNGD